MADSRKRASKWDIPSDNFSSIENKRENTPARNASDSYHEELNSKSISSKLSMKEDRDQSEISPYPRRFDNGNKRRADCRDGEINRSRWSETHAGSKERSSWDIPCARSIEEKDGYDKNDRVGWGSSLERNYGSDHNAWKQRSRSASPRNGGRRLRRSQSRSCSQSRSHSRSRSRTRSPQRGPRHANEGWNDRIRPVQGGSFQPCRDFVAGRCSRGNQCRYSHEDGGRRCYDTSRMDTRESRYDRGRPRFGSEEFLTEAVERRDFSQDKYQQSNRFDDEHRHDDFQRYRKSTEHCYNFSKGRCQKGSTCRYIHHDGQVHGFRRVEDIPGFRRTEDTPCKFFAEGRCRNGESCRFFHDSVIKSHLESRPQGKWEHTWNEENESARDASKSINQNDFTEYGTNSSWMGDEHNVRIANVSDSDRKESVPNMHDLPFQNLQGVMHQIPPEKVSRTLIVQHQNANNEAPKMQQIDSAFISNHIQQLPAFQGKNVLQKDENMAINLCDSPKNMSIYQKGQSDLVSGQSSKQCEQGHYTIPEISNPQSLNSTDHNQQAVSSMSFHDTTQQHIIYAMNPPAHNQSTTFQPPLVTQTVNFTGPVQPKLLASPNVLPHLSIGQGQFTQLQPILDTRNCENVKSQQFQYQHTLPPQGQICIERIAPRSELEVTVPLDANTDTSMSNKVVSNDQLTHLSNISASLAQILSNGQQLPQLYAALNSPNIASSLHHSFTHANSSVSSFPASASKPPSDIRSCQEHNVGFAPVREDAGVAETGKSSSGFLPGSAGQENSSYVISHINKIVDLEKKENNEKHEKVAVNGQNKGVEVDHVSMGDNKNQHEEGNSEEIVPDTQVDDEGKNIKDVKAIRLFRYALVEYVKDILKPIWKEGNMSKEAHKTIVKKVVEKVTNVMQSNIPSTQEKIDSYLSHSKAKLGKLTQAYMEKYSKI